jgi:hypothetical protein
MPRKGSVDERSLTLWKDADPDIPIRRRAPRYLAFDLFLRRITSIVALRHYEYQGIKRLERIREAGNDSQLSGFARRAPLTPVAAVVF